MKSKGEFISTSDVDGLPCVSSEFKEFSTYDEAKKILDYVVMFTKDNSWKIFKLEEQNSSSTHESGDHSIEIE